MGVAIVTGADSGIGKATAVLLAERGFDLGITWHRDEEGIAGTASEVRERPGGWSLRAAAGGSSTSRASTSRCRCPDRPHTVPPGRARAADQGVALELAEHGITVNAVAPGEIATPMTPQHEEDPHRSERPGIPLRRPGDAREVAATIAFLASAAASYVTGASFVVDGELTLMSAVRNLD